MNSKEAKFEELVGQTIIQVDGLSVGSDEVTIRTDRGTYRMYHDQDCCESVAIAEIHGDRDDLVGKVIWAYEATNRNERPSSYVDSFTWTFYRIQTERAALTIRWLGESNGYYSESVNFIRVGGADGPADEVDPQLVLLSKAQSAVDEMELPFVAAVAKRCLRRLGKNFLDIGDLDMITDADPRFD